MESGLSCGLRGRPLLTELWIGCKGSKNVHIFDNSSVNTECFLNHDVLFFSLTLQLVFGPMSWMIYINAWAGLCLDWRHYSKLSLHIYQLYYGIFFFFVEALIFFQVHIWWPHSTSASTNMRHTILKTSVQWDRDWTTSKQPLRCSHSGLKRGCDWVSKEHMQEAAEIIVLKQQVKANLLLPAVP